MIILNKVETAEFYDILKNNPQLIEGMGLTEADIAAANYLFTIAPSILNSEVRDDADGAWVHVNSEYNEVVDMIIKQHPKAVKLILNLKNDNYTFTGGYGAQHAFNLINDYMNRNFDDRSRHIR